MPRNRTNRMCAGRPNTHKASIAQALPPTRRFPLRCRSGKPTKPPRDTPFRRREHITQVPLLRRLVGTAATRRRSRRLGRSDRTEH
jgi:hypothetical protein